MRESEPDLLRQLKEIDWKYQTTPLSLEEERRLLQRRSELEKKLMIFKRAREIWSARNIVEKFPPERADAMNVPESLYAKSSICPGVSTRT